MEVQTIEKKPVAVAGKQTVSATEETSVVSERNKEVTKDTANSHLEQKAKSKQSEETSATVSETVEKTPGGGTKKRTVMSSSQQFSSEESFEESWSSTGPPKVTTTVTKQITNK
ncbi:uncharacterized protein LOC126847071 [Adelges cooleyi]|uniref:uncharacterized protein LOC126847071 n=1 Tax=Adelges cooleyi TaxID=133065 RepID=UPI00217FAF93|nr:uncharacterized protein LOC126847071 [Adelges cooleyi]